jgi:hypothetical protein
MEFSLEERPAKRHRADRFARSQDRVALKRARQVLGGPDSDLKMAREMLGSAKRNSTLQPVFFGSGFYSDVPGIGPWSGNFINHYGEIDERIGWSGMIAGGFRLDISMAGYHFNIPGRPFRNDIDGRAKLIYPLKYGEFDFTLYMAIDTERSLTLHANAIAGIVGATAGYNITPALRLEANIEAWQWSTAHNFFPNSHAFVWSVEPKASYKVDRNWTTYLALIFLEGSVLQRTDHKTKTMTKLGLSYAI